MRNFFFLLPPVVCFGRVKEFLVTLSITEQLDILSHNLENISGRTCESCMFFSILPIPHVSTYVAVCKFFLVIISSIIPNYHFSHSWVIISFFCLFSLKTGSLWPRKKFSSPGFGALIRPAFRHQAGRRDSCVQGGFCQGAVHLDPPAGGGLPLCCWAYQGGHCRYTEPQSSWFWILFF